MRMTEELRQDVFNFDLGNLTDSELIEKLPFPLEKASTSVRTLFKEVISTQNGEDVETVLTLLFLLEKEHEFTDLLHELILASWHYSYEEIIHSLQRRKDPMSVPVISAAMQQKYEALEASGTGTGQFINQCGHALRSIGNSEAIAVIRELSKTSEDPIIQTEMHYRIYKMFPDEFTSNQVPTRRWWDH